MIAPPGERPTLALPEADAACFEQRASQLLLSFQKAESKEGTQVRDWQPERPVVAHFHESNIVGPVVIERVDEGAAKVESLSVSFKGHSYDLDRAGCGLLGQLAEDWALYPKLCGFTTSEAMRDRVKRWCFGILESGEFCASVDFILADLRSELDLHEVWVQLSDVEVQDHFPMGKVEIRGVGADQIALWEQMMRANEFPADSLEMAQAYLVKKWQGHAAAVYRGYSDCDAAEVAAIEHAERACAFLRVLDPQSRLASYRSYLQPVTLKSQSNERVLLMDPGMRDFSSPSYGSFNPPCGPKITRENFPKFWEEALWKHAHQLILASPPTQFQEHLIGAVLVHSRLGLTSDPIEKLIFAIAALETMLYGGDKNARQGTLKKRLASVLAGNEKVRDHLSRVVQEAYRLRSNFMHHGQRIKDVQAIEEFLAFAWLFFRRMIESHGRWETVEGYCAALDTAYRERFGDERR